ncbi:MAG TPA: insulinase family protein [Bacteroidales bacterium]|nr:insulinase family protein [Bacteroidales bacterium]
MKKLISLVILISSLLLIKPVQAQPALTEKAPIDPEIRIGKLDNGLTYFIRKNKEPEKRASFYIIQNVGAILEEDDQQGLAHFLEHMAFNGTEHFPPLGIIDFLEKHGVAFGRNINAATGFDETVYNLSDVPVDAPGLVDSCLLVLNDWSHYLSLTDEEINKERKVIEEEWRTRRDANRRMLLDVVIPNIYKGSKYAERNIMGTPELLRSFPSNTLRNYYKKWYRPDLQAIAIVGDIDVNIIEKKIIDLFSKIPCPENPAKRPYFDLQAHDEINFVVASDKEAAQTSVNIVIDHRAPEPGEKNMAYVRDLHVLSLMNSMINIRISELMQKPNPPFVNGSISYGSFLAKKYNALILSAEARPNEEEKALEGIFTEAERVRKHGFTEGELKRAKATMLTSYETRFKQKDKISNESYIDGIVQYFLNGEPLTSIDFDYEFLKQVIDGISVEEISARFRDLTTEKNMSVFVMGLEGENIKHITEQDAKDIISRLRDTSLEAYEDSSTGETLINGVLKGADLVKTKELSQFNAVEWSFSNNTKVIYRHADFEKDNVQLAAFSFGGISALDDNNLVLPANLLGTLTQTYGIGDYDNITFQKMMAGKKASVNIGLSETAESVSGSSTPKDFETMMQLLYLRFAAPRFDSSAHSVIIDRYATLIGNMEKDPDKIKSDSLSLIMTGYNPRTPVLTRENLEKITIDEVKQIYTDRFNAADEFTFFIVGNIAKDTVLQMSQKYIGSLPAKGRSETWIDRNVEQPDGRITKAISMPLTVPKSTVVLAFANEMKYTPQNYLAIEVIGGMLDIVLTEKIREDEGGTYGVSVGFSASKRPDEISEGLITFDCDPERANDLKARIYNEIDNLVKNGPDKEILGKAVNNILKTREENKLHNSYWMNTLTRYYSYGINSDDPNNYENVLKSFTGKDIKNIAGKMFKKADVVDVVFKPE